MKKVIRYLNKKSTRWSPIEWATKTFTYAYDFNVAYESVRSLEHLFINFNKTGKPTGVRNYADKITCVVLPAIQFSNFIFEKVNKSFLGDNRQNNEILPRLHTKKLYGFHMISSTRILSFEN